MTWALEGVVQLDRSGDPPRVMLDTTPAQRLDVRWADVLGCWLVRVTPDSIARRHSVVFEMLVVAHRGPFFRVIGEDAFWPSAEMYGLALDSMAGIAQREQRAARPQIQLAIPSPRHDLGTVGTRPPRRRKGRR